MNSPTTLPPLIRTTLEERRGYHQRFFYTFIGATSVMLILFIFFVAELQHEDTVPMLILLLVVLAIIGTLGYLIVHHNKQKKVLDACLDDNQFTVIKGALQGIGALKHKRVCYFIDRKEIEGTLIFPGFTAFQNTNIVNVITGYKDSVQLYILSNGLLAGAFYPELEEGMTSRPITKEDWKIVADSQLGTLILYGYLALFLNLITVGTCWLIDHATGAGWEMLGEFMLIMNGVVLLFVGIETVVNWKQFRALRDRHHPSIQIQVYQGLTAEWYLTATRYSQSTAKTYNGWIRMAGALHRIQLDDLFLPDRDILEPMKNSMQLEYLSYKGRSIFLKSTPKPI